MPEAIFKHEAQVRAALHAVVSDPAHGAEALSSPQIMTNLLKDFLPDAPRESGLLIAAAQAGIADALRQHVSDGLDATTAMALASRSLADSTAYGPEACSWAAHELAIALGLADTRPQSGGAPADEAAAIRGGAAAGIEAETIQAAGPPSSPEAAPRGEETRQAAAAAATEPPATELAQPPRLDAPAEPEQGRKPGGAGRAVLVIAGCLVVVIGIVVGVLEATGSPSGKSLTLSQLRTGDCLTGVNFTQSLPDTYQQVPCRQQHVAQVFLRSLDFWSRSAAWPGSRAVAHQALAGCNNAFAAYDGLSADKTTYSSAWTYPAASSWQSGDRSLICWAYLSTSADPGGAPIYGSIQNSDK